MNKALNVFNIFLSLKGTQFPSIYPIVDVINDHVNVKN